MQLEHCQRLLSMQQNELDSEDMIVKDMCNTLKQYYFLLQGHNLATEAMVSHYGVSFCSFQLNDISPHGNHVSLLSFSYSLSLLSFVSFLLSFSFIISSFPLFLSLPLPFLLSLFLSFLFLLSFFSFLHILYMGNQSFHGEV